ncbi:transglutaminase domain-containing protein [Patescibacteria group bacterium]
MKKIIFTLLLFLIFPKSTYANEISVVSDTTYNLDTGAVTHVIHSISIDNQESGKYASDFILRLHDIEPFNITANENKIPLATSLIEEGESKSIIVNFVKKNLGNQNVKNFQIEYDLMGVAAKSGDVWELNLPKLAENNIFSIYNTKVVVPRTFGDEAYIDPEPIIFESTDTSNIYHFDKQQLEQSRVIGAFGDFQSYLVDITYHLENPLSKNTKIEIAIPPDTDFQRSSILEINPEPIDIRSDQDGNWIAIYTLTPRQQLDVAASVLIDIFPVSRNIDLPKDDYLWSLTHETEYWDYGSIDPLPDHLDTPRRIYDFVLRELNYDYKKIGTNVKRIGASNALLNPSSAICTEYSDATVALLRRAGIPAREIQGFAYSENAVSEPISLVEDVLHSWVEYWDTDRHMWVQIDPTWDDTSTEDYFNNFDLKHITFVRHGTDSLKPFPPGSYNYGSTPQKDVSVSIRELGTESKQSSQIVYKVSNTIPFLRSNLSIEVKNIGNTAIYDENLEIYHDGTLVDEFTISELLPFSSTFINTKMPFSLSGSELPDNVSIRYADSMVKIPTQKSLTTYINITVILLFLFMVLMFLFYKARSLRK